jgi:aspartyl-tRNA(Asn)/glutamyl-tRNA(Gln) amidotransferase subunit C
MADEQQHAIGPDQVAKVAQLARLALDARERERFAPQLESILHYVDQLQSLDVSNVEPMAHALPLANVLRDDVAGPALPLDKVLQNAPESDGPFFKVPKVIGGDEDSAGCVSRQTRAVTPA